MNNSVRRQLFFNFSHWFPRQDQVQADGPGMIQLPTRFFGRDIGGDSYGWFNYAPMQTVARAHVADFETVVVEVGNWADAAAKKALEEHVSLFRTSVWVELSQLRFDSLWQAT